MFHRFSSLDFNKMQCNAPLFFVYQPYHTQVVAYIRNMERFLDVFDKKFGVDAEDFFLKGIFYIM